MIRKSLLSILFLSIALFLLFFRLDSVNLIQDEGETACVARTITAQHVLPSMWDGNVLFVQWAGDINRFLSPAMQSWGQYYLTKLSFLLSGKESVFWARFPHAFLGLLTLFLLWHLAKRIYKTAYLPWVFVSTILFSFYFLGFVRLCRYYSLVIFFASLTLFLLRDVISTGKKITFRRGVLLFIVGVCMYYAHYLNFGLFFLSIGLYIVLFSRQNLLMFAAICLGISIIIVPDYIYFHSAYFSTVLQKPGIVLFELKTIANLMRMMPSLVIVSIVMLWNRKMRISNSTTPWFRVWIIAIMVIIASYVLPNANDRIVARYMLYMVPLSFILLFFIVESEIEKRKHIAAILLIIFTLLIQGSDYFSNIAEGVVLRQFLKQDHYEGDTVAFLKPLIKKGDTLMSMPNSNNQIYYFNFPNNKMIGQIPDLTSMKKRFSNLLPESVFMFRTQPTYVIIRGDKLSVNKDIQTLVTHWPQQYVSIYQRTFQTNTPLWQNNQAGIKHVLIYKRTP